ncbi:thromboxane-A synthase-like [Myripristis murdjan]|uniref:thromboxane-A synthase-like n=1 Tax=Myripristis murdjan TaxID=586833 RepID=UPI001175E08F|nr:thromboxane-A synthase-like [Myripristis murdjan]
MEAIADLLQMFHVEASGLSMSLSLFLIFLALLCWYSVSPFSALSRCGIKHPKPLPFFGNMFMFHQGVMETTFDLINKHGRVCGYYLGRMPVVVVADPDILRQVTIKEFSTFPNRQYVINHTKPVSDGLQLLRDEHWKRVRGILTPSFSGAKLKEMVPLINTTINTLMNILNAHAKSGEAFDIHRCFNCFTMDVIATVAYGIQLDSQSNPDDRFVHFAKKYFIAPAFNPLMLLVVAFPFLKVPLLSLFPNKSRAEMDSFFINCIQRIIKERDEQPPEQRRRDFLQLMLDARNSNECVSMDQFDMGNHANEVGHGNQQTDQSVSEQDCHQPQASSAKSSQKRTITDDEIVGQALVFLLAGYETTSSTLAFTCYLLALHPECQRKVQDEVDQFYCRHESPDYFSVQELKYLDMVISEALRLYSPGFRFARTIDKECVVNGQLLPKGAYLEIAASYLHRDPEYWPEPEKFIPERFTPEAKANRHPCVYLPFGAGPRNCVGMRLAQLEMKMALVQLFRRFNVVTCSETKVPLELTSAALLGPKNGVIVKIARRDMGEGQRNPTTK